MNQPVELQLTRFEFRGSLGQGGMGVVYRAFDRERRLEVALKTLPSMHADGVYRLKREFRSLAELSHPNLVNLYELFCEQGTWFFTMELVPGTTFLSWVADAFETSEATTRRLPPRFSPAPQPDAKQAILPGAVDPTWLRPSLAPGHDATFMRADSRDEVDDAAGGRGAVPPIPPIRRPRGFDEPRLRDALRQLSRGVLALHRAGKQHRDLKPANVMVDAGGRVVLLDFGLAAARSDDLYGEDPLDVCSGTPAYMAPERFSDAASTDASDWFSVGVILYEALTGVKPFLDPSVFRGAPVVPPPPTALVEDVPDDLSELALDLLRWSPSERPTGEQVLQRLGDKPPASAVAPVALVGGRGSFVGREAHLDALRGAYEAVISGRPVMVQVLGTSGFGKTTLVRHFLQSLHDEGRAIVLSGRCYERESMPFKVFDSLIDSLTAYLQTLDDSDVAQLLPRDVRVLAKLFPPLLRIPAVADAPHRDLEVKDAQENARLAQAALKSFFGSIGARKPLVLFIDDVQWGDLDSARLLADVLRPPLLKNVLIILSYRSEELDANAVLRQILEAREIAGVLLETRSIEVGPLTGEEARELTERILQGEGARELDPEAIIREASGSPLFVQQMAHHAYSGSTLSSPRRISLADVLRARMTQLSPGAAALLTAIAVAGRPVPQKFVLETAELTVGADEALNALRAGMLVRVSGPRLTDKIEVFHDKIRETVVADLAADQLGALHARIAGLLERVTPVDVEALTLHWDAAGDLQKAAHYAMLAASRANEALAFGRAADLFRIALRGLDPAGKEAAHARVALAGALRNAGRTPEAAEAYLAAAGHLEDEAERLELKRLAFEQFLVSGDLARGRALGREVLATVGLRMPITGRGALASLVWQRVKVSLRGTKFKEREEAQIPRDLLRRIDACWSMATGLSIIDTKLGADFTARYLLFALQGGEVGRLARGLAMEAAHITTSGNFERAEALIAMAARLADRADDHARGIAAQMTGFLQYFRGNYRRSLAAFDDAASIFRSRCTGMNWELSTTQMFSNWCLVYLGEWPELAERAPRLVLEARQSGNLYRLDGLVMSGGVTTALMEDDVDGVREEMAEAARQWTPEGFQIQHFLRVYMGGWVDMYAGDAAAAYDRLVKNDPALRASLLLQVEDVRYRIALLRGYSAVGAGAGGSKTSAARAAVRTLRKIASIGAQGVADVIDAALAHQEGNVDVAVTRLGSAAAEFDRAEMALFAAATRWRLGQLEQGDAGRDHVQRAKEAMLGRAIKQPERVLRLLAPGFGD